jgi:hypothetical protein
MSSQLACLNSFCSRTYPNRTALSRLALWYDRKTLDVVLRIVWAEPSPLGAWLLAGAATASTATGAGTGWLSGSGAAALVELGAAAVRDFFFDMMMDSSWCPSANAVFAWVAGAQRNFCTHKVVNENFLILLAKVSVEDVDVTDLLFYAAARCSIAASCSNRLLLQGP